MICYIQVSLCFRSSTYSDGLQNAVEFMDGKVNFSWSCLCSSKWSRAESISQQMDLIDDPIFISDGVSRCCRGYPRLLSSISKLCLRILYGLLRRICDLLHPSSMSFCRYSSEVVSSDSTHQSNCYLQYSGCSLV